MEENYDYVTLSINQPFIFIYHIYYNAYLILNEKKLKKYILLFIKTLQIHKYYNNYEFVFFKCMLR
ncbi:hypothetical protein PFAG_00241 [Plasmodium falciparum Santa Lucia]|uniref:Uncharacterized protein n=3 Tax=Plasmodium falciparum TaxID=5833 RepID=A0A024WEM1_PLAFA|nr:hypothetical protein PFTANZ_00272 [Plasmodium falciparum Tanzania (2000708)]ETW57795.1 hypothetical protein PFUGPA_00245 [Plasmodium falciparum Palo Alto/Uganda]EUT93113.1 hypothetical protein PFAG_00241 [Plasmodium falciparum Santa Lucia]